MAPWIRFALLHVPKHSYLLTDNQTLWRGIIEVGLLDEFFDVIKRELDRLKVRLVHGNVNTKGSSIRSEQMRGFITWCSGDVISYVRNVPPYLPPSTVYNSYDPTA